MADIFISYAREDREFVERLCSALKKHNRETWIDLEGILPSAEWRKEIFSAIENSLAIVQVVSPYSAASEICSEELKYAVNNNKRIIPVLRKDVDESALPDAIRDRHWIYCRDADDFDLCISNLIRTLDTNIEWIRTHTRLLNRAAEWEKHNRDNSYALRGSDLRAAEAALASGDQLEPRLLPSQIDYILASRRSTSRRSMLVVGSGAIALVGLVILGALFVTNKQESALNLAANFREMGISELENNDPLAAEDYFAKALSINNNIGARERLVQARTRSPRLLWINAPTVEDSTISAVSGDGVLIAVASPLKLSIWNVLERKQIRTLPMRTGVQEKAIAVFGPLHRLFAIGIANKVSVWDLQSASEQPLATFVTRSDVSSLSVGSNDLFVIVGEEDGSISSWNVKERNESPPLKLLGHSDRITNTAISADNRTLVSGSWDETAKVWDLQTGTNSATFTGHDDALLCVAISPNGEEVASAGWDDTIWIWDRKTGKGIRALTGHRGSILSLAFSADGKWLVSGSEDRTARLWEVARGRHILTFPGHSGDVTSVAFLSSDGKEELVTGDANGSVRLWDLSTIGQREELTTLRGPGAVTMIDFDSVAPLLVSSTVNNSIDVWNTQTGRLAQEFPHQSGSVSAVAFSPNGKYLASATKESMIRLFDLVTGESRIIQAEDPKEKIRHIAFNPKGNFIAGGSEDGKIRIWNTETGIVERSFAAHTAKIQGLRFSPDSVLLASSSEDATVKLWTVGSWDLKTSLIGHRSGVYEIAFSPDGKFLVSGSDDKTMRLWNVASGKEAISPVNHGSPVWAVDFDDDGKTIASGSEDSTVQLWKITENGTKIDLHDHVVFRISDGPIWWLKFHGGSNEDSLGIASQDKTVRILRLSKLESLFSNPEKLQHEAEEQGGLVIGQGPNGEPQIAPIGFQSFVAK